ncbi:inorganic pyrophosphatase isoform X1 [Procambarus clarkii]|uniref:inorganic pyrophosphatase isoform X1 n=1 Tax=Procambarus clarkii TaxID=6728 RepID=UPI001E676F6B|nr:inorganic pyrophosphatase-like [Procambarus clarkii]
MGMIGLLVVLAACVGCQRVESLVKNNVSLVMPDGRIVPWWPVKGSVPSIIGPGVKVHINTKVNLGHKPSSTFEALGIIRNDQGKESEEQDEDGSDIKRVTKEPCVTCGKPCGGSGGSQNHEGTRTPTVVWPASTSQFSGLNVTVIERGRFNTPSYHIYFQNENGPLSPFHDVPLFANEGNKIFNMVVEVPRWTNAKMEISTKDPLNPIKQDVKKGKLRFVANCFPHHGYIWNYGALPQTWEDPNHIDEATGCKGDNDPIDVCEIGYRVAKRGEVIQVKVLGTLALIDEGETDWKLIAIDVNDPLAPQLSDISDVEKHMPGFLKASVEWFRIYKIPDGKPENQFAFNGLAKDRDFAHKIIMETHEAWQNLVEGKTDAGGHSTSSVSVPNCVNKLTSADAQEVVDGSPEPGPAQPIDPKVDLWHYVTLK